MRCTSGAFLLLEVLCAVAALLCSLHGLALLPLAFKEEIGERSGMKMTPHLPWYRSLKLCVCHTPLQTSGVKYGHPGETLSLWGFAQLLVGSVPWSAMSSGSPFDQQCVVCRPQGELLALLPGH